MDTLTPTARVVLGTAIDERLAYHDVAGDELTFYLTNHQGSTVAMAKEDGTFVPTYYKYDPYGNELSDAPLAGQPYRYTGRRLDPQTGLCAPAGAFSLYI